MYEEFNLSLRRLNGAFYVHLRLFSGRSNVSDKCCCCVNTALTDWSKIDREKSNNR